jgi:uncharacterized protein YecT (DUF1311 family)
MVVTAAPASVQAGGKPSAADRKAITACLDKAEREFRSALPCVGLLADRCLREIKAGGDAEACAKRELVVWTERLERAWPRFEAGVPAEERTNQIRAQEAWFTYRNAFYPVRSKLDPGYVLGGAALPHA